MDDLDQLRKRARAIFFSAIAEAQRAQSALAPINWDPATATNALAIPGFSLDPPGNVYAIAIGKAAAEMAAGLNRKLGSKLTAGIVAVPQTADYTPLQLTGWRTFAAGHPLPNEASLAAAQAAFALLDQANHEEALVVFLISGGGSASMEWPANDQLSLEDLREANRLLISCGATIAEINAVRRTFSAIKGGKLAARAPHARKVTLIVSDVNRGEESNVASGPTLAAAASAPDPREVVERYELSSTLPTAVMAAFRDTEISTPPNIQIDNHVSSILLDSQGIIDAAVRYVRAQGLPTAAAFDICEQPIAKGCELLLTRVHEMVKQSRNRLKPACLISGGEFSCPVRGNGIGGRNLETALRYAIEVDGLRSNVRHVRDAFAEPNHIVLLSAGTDGIDGNSPAAGAIVDETTVARGRALGLDAAAFLNNSDAFNYLNALGDALVTGPTATNVRDLRVMLVSAGW